MSEYDQMIADATRAIESNPNDAEAYVNRSFAYGQSGQNDAAISDLTRAIELNPKFYGAYYLRSQIYFRLGQNDAAISDINKAIELDPNDSDGYEMRGRIYGKIENHDAAISDFERAIVLAQDPTYKVYQSLAGQYADKRHKCRNAGNMADYFICLKRTIENLEIGINKFPANSNADETKILTNMEEWKKAAEGELESRKKVFDGVGG